MIRDMAESDAGDLVLLLYDAYQEIAYSRSGGGEFNPPDVYDALIAAYSNLNQHSYVYEIDGKIEGFVSFLMVRPVFNRSIKRAVEVAWHSSPKLKKFTRTRIMIELLNHVFDQFRGVCDSYLISVQKDNDIGKFLERHGAKLVEYNYILEV